MYRQLYEQVANDDFGDGGDSGDSGDGDDDGGDGMSINILWSMKKLIFRWNKN